MSWSWMTSEESHYHFKLTEGEAFVVIQLKALTTGAIVDSSNMENFKREFHSLKNNTEVNSVKILGSSEVITDLQSFFQNQNCRISKSSAKTTSLEIFYRPLDGQIRIRPVKLKLSSNRKLRVFVVDDSKSMRIILKKILETDGDIEVVAESGHPVEALKMIDKVRPDVITLDIYMPEMNGVEMLKQYYPKNHIPTIMVTSIRMEEGPLIIDALDSGAIDYFEKPEMSRIGEIGKEMRERVRVAAETEKRAKLESVEELKLKEIDSDYEVLAIGASTGGTEVIRYILSSLPKRIPPIVIVQHMPAVFTKAFANRLDAFSDLHVSEAEDGDVLKDGNVYIAPGGYQLSLKREKGQLVCRVGHSGPINRHEPSVDVLFKSIADISPTPRTLAMLMTGMGFDGAEGLLMLKSVGQVTAIQSEKTCTVWGMPRVAKELSAQDFIWDLQQFPVEICRHISKSIAS